jgi:hypothetical protein
MLPQYPAKQPDCIISAFMPKFRRKPVPMIDPLFAAKTRKAIPYQFVLEAIAALSPMTRPMFGCTAVYVEEKIVLILREKPTYSSDNGVWLATTKEHHESLRSEFPNMRSIGVLGKEITGWQILPSDAPDFEEAALHACDLVLTRDPRIGKIPGVRRSEKFKIKIKNRAKPSKPAKAVKRSRRKS